MKPRLQFLALVVVLLLASLSASAHEDEQIPTGAPDKLGEVNFEVSCNAAAQLEFNRAVAMLHSFFGSSGNRVGSFEGF
jgi:hypothetical protein